MRALLRPMGCGPVLPRTPVRVSAHPRGQYAVWSRGQSLRPHAELSQVSNLGAAAAVVAGSVQGDEHECSRAARRTPVGSARPGA